MRCSPGRGTPRTSGTTGPPRRPKRQHEMTVQTDAVPAAVETSPTFGEAFRLWLKIGCINFGGPAGQIAMMHRMLVDEKKWIDEPRFLHAAARSGSAEACDLHRLGAAWRARRACGRHSVRAAGRVRDARLEPALCARARRVVGRWRAVRHQGGGA